jgi:digeranylgeranylglycerophospholipid reductase
MDYDFIVVGAGPVGSFLAKSLSIEGWSVGLFEGKKEVGEGVICSGIIGRDAYGKFNLPEEAIVRKISSLKVFSPSLVELEYLREEPFAYIVERKKFDKELVKEASIEGVDISLESRVVDIQKARDRISIKYCRNDREFKKSARCIVIASGTNFSLHRKIGLSVPGSVLWGNRVEVKGGNGKGSVEVYILNEPDLSSFGWIIPMNGCTRIGSLSSKSSQESLKSLIYKSNGRFNVNFDKLEKAPIACGNSEKITGERVLAVGEAAGQVKTTTGGGIYYGLIGASIAGEILSNAAKINDFSAGRLKEYEDIWINRMGEEIRNGIMVRKMASKLTPQIVDNVFNFLKKNPTAKEELEDKFCFDYHRDIIKSGIGFFINKVPKKFSSFVSLFK